MDQKLHENITELCKKTPTYSKVILKLVEGTSIDFEHIKTVYKEIKTYDAILKKAKFNPLKMKTFEELEDSVKLILEESKAKTMMKSLLSKKHRHLCDIETEKIFKEFIRYDISTKAVRDFVTSKILRYRTSIEFNKVLKEFLKEMREFNADSVIKDIQTHKLNADVLYNENNKMIVRVHDYKASQYLGSPSWCISYRASYFDSYVKENSIVMIGNTKINNIQLFIWDFDKEPSDKTSMIGVTYNATKKFIAAHHKDDSYLREIDLVKLFNFNVENYVNEDELIIKTIKESGESLSRRFFLVCRYVKNKEFILKSFYAMQNHQKKNNLKMNLRKAYMNNLVLFNKDITNKKDVENLLSTYKDFSHNIQNDQYFSLGISMFLLKNATLPWIQDVLAYLDKENLFNVVKNELSVNIEQYIKSFNQAFGDKSHTYHRLQESNFLYFKSQYLKEANLDMRNIKELIVSLIKNDNESALIELMNNLTQENIKEIMDDSPKKVNKELDMNYSGGRGFQGIYRRNEQDPMTTREEEQEKISKMLFFLGTVKHEEKYNWMQRLISVISNKRNRVNYVWSFMNPSKIYTKYVDVQKTIDVLGLMTVEEAVNSGLFMGYNNDYNYYSDEYRYKLSFYISVLKSDLRYKLIDRLIKSETVFPELANYIKKEDILNAMKKSENPILRLL